MKERIENVMRQPAVAHIRAANARYSKRLGPQFSAAVTYFSVLSVIPVIMFAVSMLGMTLTVLRPDWLELVRATINEELGNSSQLAEDIGALANQALSNWLGLGLTALVTAGYAGSKWIGTLKKALRVMWRDRFLEAAATRNFVLEFLENVVIFFGLLISMLVALAVTAAGGLFSSHVISWLGWEDIDGITGLLRIISIILVLVASWLVFAFLFTVLPGKPPTLRIWLVGTIAGSVALTGMQQLAGIIIGLFSGNVSLAIFGPVILMLLLFNILATMILMIAAWMGTDATWPAWLEARENGTDPDDPDAGAAAGLRESDRNRASQTLPSTPRSWAEKRRQERWAARKPLDELRAVNYDPEHPPELVEAPAVPQDVAARSVRVGWGIGAAAGIGIGAVIAGLAGWITRR